MTSAATTATGLAARPRLTPPDCTAISSRSVLMRPNATTVISTTAIGKTFTSVSGSW